MSYARFGWDDSDVYVFTSKQGIECCFCLLKQYKWIDGPNQFFGGHFEVVGDKVETVFRTNAGMIEHLDKHREAGHIVPEDAYNRLRDPEDELENQRIWQEHDSRTG